MTTDDEAIEHMEVALREARAERDALRAELDAMCEEKKSLDRFISKDLQALRAERDAARTRSAELNQTCQGLEATVYGLRAELSREVDDGVARLLDMAEQRNKEMDKADALRASHAELVEALRRMLSERGCAGCLVGDQLPDYVRGKDTRAAADEHEAACANRVAIAALADAEKVGK